MKTCPLLPSSGPFRNLFIYKPSFSSVQSLSCVWLLATPCTAACQASHHQFPELTQTHVHRVSDAIQHLIPCRPLLLPPSFFPSIRVFQMSQFFASSGQSIGVSASTSMNVHWIDQWMIIPMNVQDLFPLGCTGLISLQSKGLSRVFSNTTVQKYQFFCAQLSL